MGQDGALRDVAPGDATGQSGAYTDGRVSTGGESGGGGNGNGGAGGSLASGGDSGISGSGGDGGDASVSPDAMGAGGDAMASGGAIGLDASVDAQAPEGSPGTGGSGSGGVPGTDGGPTTDSGCVVNCDCDFDGDGYLAETCGGDDCDDTDSRAHPDQTTYFATARNSGGFDFDCDGESTPNPAQYKTRPACVLDLLQLCPTGQQGYASASNLPSCGNAASWQHCVAGALGACNAVVIDQRTLSCR